VGDSARTRKQDAAWLLLKHHTGREVAPPVFGESGVPGARPDAWADTVPKESPMFRVFEEFMDSPGPEQLAVPDNFKMLEYQGAVQKALEPLWKGELSVDATVAAALGPIQQQLDLARAAGR
jgi:hypothetical protein